MKFKIFIFDRGAVFWSFRWGTSLHIVTNSGSHPGPPEGVGPHEDVAGDHRRPPPHPHAGAGDGPRNSGAILAQFWRNSGAILLTPASLVLQVAKFLMWVEKNKASMDLLNSLNHADLA